MPCQFSLAPHSARETMGLAEYSSKVQQRPQTAASQHDRQCTEQAGRTAKRPAAPLVRDEEAVRNHDETAALEEHRVDRSTAGRSHGADEDADSSLPAKSWTATWPEGQQTG
jgi:hypothetical protein